jgi:cytidylate kinase
MDEMEQEKNRIRVAIDGPSGAGKSTIARAIAKRMEMDYIDTGAMYRAVAFKMLQNKVPVSDLAMLETMLADTEIDFVRGNVLLDGEIINSKIRTPEVSALASECSALAPVREKLVRLQREMGEKKSIIMDGRDIGTNVLTDAEFKFYLNANPEERARRRHLELLEKGQETSYLQVLEDIRIRDHNDMTRALNPLRKAEDAREIDTTGMNLEQVILTIIDQIKGE